MVSGLRLDTVITAMQTQHVCKHGTPYATCHNICCTKLDKLLKGRPSRRASWAAAVDDKIVVT